jgi:transcription elongation factor GreB
MSKAFTNEESTQEVLVPPRPPLPPGVPNYVTPRGLELLRAERLKLEAARAALDAGPDEGRTTELGAWAARMAELEQRLASAQLVDPASHPPGIVRFGATVTVRDEAGRSRTYQIVGVDEADPAAGKIAFLSPLARALLGAEVGDSVVFETPGRVQELEITASE